MSVGACNLCGCAFEECECQTVTLTRDTKVNPNGFKIEIRGVGVITPLMDKKGCPVCGRTESHVHP